MTEKERRYYRIDTYISEFMHDNGFECHFSRIYNTSYKKDGHVRNIVELYSSASSHSNINKLFEYFHKLALLSFGEFSHEDNSLVITHYKEIDDSIYLKLENFHKSLKGVNKFQL